MRRFFAVFATALICTALLSGQALAIADDELAGEGTGLIQAIDQPDALTAETPLGDVTADAARYVSGADIAIVNGGDFFANLIGGEIYYADCRAVFAEDRALAVAAVSPAQLKALLEHGVSHIEITADEYIDREASAFGGFPQVSGFQFMYDVVALPGERVVWVKMDGQELDLTDETPSLMLCATAYMLSGGWDYPALEASQCGETLSTALFGYIRGQGTVEPPEFLNRMRTRGSNDSSLFGLLNISPFLLVIAMVCFAVLRGAAGSKFKKFYDFER